MSPPQGNDWGDVSVRNTIQSTVGATAAALRHLGWWLDWHTRANPSDGSRGPG